MLYGEVVYWNLLCIFMYSIHSIYFRRLELELDRFALSSDHRRVLSNPVAISQGGLGVMRLGQSMLGQHVLVFALVFLGLSDHSVLVELHVEPRVVDPHKHVVHSQEEPAQQQQPFVHDPYFHVEYGYTVVCELVFEEDHVVVE